MPEVLDEVKAGAELKSPRDIADRSAPKIEEGVSLKKDDSRAKLKEEIAKAKK